MDNKCWRECEEKGTLVPVGGNVNWYSYYGKQYGVSSKKLKTRLPYDPAVPLLGTHLKQMKTLIQKYTCIQCL